MKAMTSVDFHDKVSASKTSFRAKRFLFAEMKRFVGVFKGMILHNSAGDQKFPLLANLQEDSCNCGEPTSKNVLCVYHMLQGQCAEAVNQRRQGNRWEVIRRTSP
jgi:hypothetical protein